MFQRNRAEGTHLEAVKEELDHDQARGFENQSGDLAEETRHDKVELAVGGKGATKRDHLGLIHGHEAAKLYTHADNDNQAAVGVLQTEGKRDQQDDDRVERLMSVNAQRRLWSDLP